MSRRILVVDDLAANRFILKGMLSREYEVLEASNGQMALDMLSSSKEPVSAVLLDISMPVMDGYDVLKWIRSNELYSQLPVIMITGSDDEDTRIKSLTLGANDFVMKPYSSSVIRHCLKNNIALRETAAAVDLLQKDRLTGVWNREAFFQKAAAEIEKNPASYFVLACIDVDGFKMINDRFGTEVGDSVLVSLAKAIQHSCDVNGGLCGRIFADCFICLYPLELIEKVGIGPQMLETGIREDTGMTVTLSVGRYVVEDKCLSVRAMYDRARIAQTMVKHRYDAHVAVFDESMLSDMLREQELVGEMNAALSEGQFQAWFQPQYNHATGALFGAEALVRWVHPKKGIIPPNAFIPVFEQNGFIYSLDKFVWEEVCRHLRRWLDAGRSPLPISVNISRYDLLRPDIVNTITGLVEKYSLPIELLRLEITESAFSESSKLIVDIVKQLIDCGFTVEIDDFGSGYSSLNTLKDVPAQILKLDMKFLEDSSDSQRGGNIVESVIRMAKWLNMSVIAEGVETTEQADYLRSIGCNYIQGYLYARPMPIEQFEEHCSDATQEVSMPRMETVGNLDNNAFWDPASMDTLIFNSYVGGACIYEYYQGKIELLRVTEKYAQVIGGAGLTVEDALKLNWQEHLDNVSREKVYANLGESIASGKEITDEYVFLDLPGCPHETYLRSSLRVIASAGERHLVYCTNENITAQRMAEQSERNISDRMRAIMDNVDLGIIAAVVENDGAAATARYLFANNRYYEMLGYTKEQFDAEVDSPYMTIALEDRQMVVDETSRINLTGKPITLLYKALKRDGTRRAFRASISTCRLSGVSEPVQFSILRDVTEEVETESREQRAAEQMQAIMSDIDSGITAAVLDDDGFITLLFTNDKFFEIHGYTREEYESLTVDKFELVHPDDREKARRDTVHAYFLRTPTRLEYRLIKKNGTVCWVRVDLSSTRFTGIEQNVHLCIFTDITEEKRKEQEIKEASEQLRTMMDDIPGGFVRIRLEENGVLTPVFFNEGFYKLSGMSNDELMRMYAGGALEGVHPDDVAIVNKVVSEMLENGKAQSARYRLRHGSGDYIWLSVFGRVTKDAAGDTFFNVYYTDATEQVKEDERRKELLDNLPGGAGWFGYDSGKLTVIHLNRGYWELVGRQPVAYEGLTPAAALHPDDIDVVTGEMTVAAEQGRDLSCDVRLYQQGVGYRAVRVIGRIARCDTGGRFIYAIFTPISDETTTYQQMMPLLHSAMMESATDLSFAKDTGFRYLSASRAVADLVGIKDAKELIGKTDFDMFDIELAEKYRQDDMEMLQSGRAVVDKIEPIPSKDGTPRYSCTSKYLLRDGNGVVIGLYGVGRDVTASVERDSQLSLVNDSIPGGLAAYVCTYGEFSPKHIKLSYFNDGFCRLFGYTHDEYDKLAASDPLTSIFKEDLHIIAEQWKALMDNGTPINCLYRAHLKGGGYKWINHRAVASDRRNDTVVMNAILQDVTDQRELIEQLRISEEENYLAVRLGGSIIGRYMVEERTLCISPEIAAANSLPEVIHDVPETPVREGMISEESAKAYTGFFEAIQSGSRAATAIFRQRYFDSWRWMEAKSSTIFSDDGKPIKAVITFCDVTDALEKETVYKKWQQSLSDKNPASYTLYCCNLNKSSSFDTSEGALIVFDFDGAGDDFNERSAVYARRMVSGEDADRYIAFVNSDALLAGYYRGRRSDTLDYREQTPNGKERWLRLTIDLVESPNSTDVQAYLMYEDIDEAKRTELLAKEMSESDPLTGILNRAAFAAKVDRLLKEGSYGERSSLFMLDIDGFKQVNDVFGHGAGDHTLIDIAEGLRSMMRRGDLVGRLGGDEFVVFMKDVSDDEYAAQKARQMCSLARRSFSMEVQISGSVGIATAPHDGMDFDTLYKKADSALYYVKGSGKDGYVFYSDNMEDEHLKPETETASQSGFRKHEKRRRMLIVDDNSIDHELLKNIFADDFIVDKASDGNSALIRLRHYGTAISVVLLDLMMPGMDGFAVLEKMQSSHDLKNIPVIIVSGDESRDSCLKAIREGATDFITKPVDAEILKIRVSSAVSKAENERLRAKNCMLEVQNDERVRYEAALKSSGMTFIDYNWNTGEFTYYPSISDYLFGRYDDRKLWYILLSDMVADTRTVQDMQLLVHHVAEDRKLTGGSLIVSLKTPKGVFHSFRMNVRKLTDEFDLTNRVIITLNDLDYEGC